MELRWDVMGGEAVFPFAVNPTWVGFVPRVTEEVAINTMQLYAGFDYGSTNPSAFVVWGFDKQGNAYALYEIYEPCTNYIAMANKIKACPYFPHLKMMVADPQIWASDQIRKRGTVSIADLFAEQGIHFTKGNHGTDYEIAQRFRSYYWADPNQPKAFITSACPKGRWELGNLRLEKYASQLIAAKKNNPEKIVQKNNHWWDATSLLFDKRPRPLVVVRPSLNRNTFGHAVDELEREERGLRECVNYVRAC